MFAAILSEKMVLVLVTLLGMAFCSAGIGQVAARGEWLHPMSIAASVMGVLVLGIVGAGLFDFKLPLIDSTRAATIAVIVIVIAKVVLTQVHRLIA
ncbi:MAG: hypothetical protein IT328_15565 [Caldilineaceae bacterium]|nr:hypothetical protein [Caldilineaceae bacterium]